MTTHLCPLTPWRLPASLAGLFLLAVCFMLPLAARAAEGVKQKVNLPADTAEKSLKRLSEQTGAEVLYPTNFAKDVRTNRVTGEYTPREALDRMLDGTGLVAAQDSKTGALTVRKETPEEAKNDSSRAAANDRAAGALKDGVLKLDTFEVFGRKTLNMDIRRTRDDAQPYVTFDRDVMEYSGVSNLDDFLKQRLTMNSAAVSDGQFGGGGITGSTSTVNLRGLGEGKTLILIDGRRASGPAFNNDPGQTNLNGIPMSAVERIEVLPAASAGIYGGSATGGVVNVILRRNYSGGEMKLTYDNSFESDTGLYRLDFSVGHSLAGGRTSLFLAGSYSDANGMVAADRGFLARARAVTLANNPTFLLSAAATPQGATANIGSSNGSNLVLKNGTALNSPITFAPVGYAGAANDGGAALVANAGRFNLDLSPTARPGSGTPGDMGGQKGLLQATGLRSLIGTLRHQLTDSLDVYLSLMAGDQRGSNRQFSTVGRFTLPASAPTNPFQQSIIVQTPNPQFASTAFSRNESFSLNAGVILKLPHDLLVSADYGWNLALLEFTFDNGRILPEATAAVTSGALDILRDPQVFFTDFSPYIGANQYTIDPFKNVMQVGSVRFAKPVHELPGGRMTLSGFAEVRADLLKEASYFSGGNVAVFPRRTRDIHSAYLETKVPFFGQRNRRGGLERLELQVAGRWEKYRARGFGPSYNPTVGPSTLGAGAENNLESTDYTLGLFYSPHRDWILRSSYGTGFQPPTVLQLVPFAAATGVTGIGNDPRRGNEPIGTITVERGGNPSLLPEHSRSLSYGFVFAPRRLEGLRVSADYFFISQEGRIGLPPGGVLAFLPFESLFPERVIRGPVTPGDPFGVGRITTLDVREINLGQVDVEAYDLALDYTWKSARAGTFSVLASATYQVAYDIQVVQGQPVIGNVGISATLPLRWKANVGLNWSVGPWSAGWNTRYFDSYFAADPRVATSANTILNQGNGGKVPSQDYHDFFLGYKFGHRKAARGGWRTFTQDLEFQGGIRNVFNAAPPFDAASPDSTYYSAFGDPRLRSYWVSLKKGF